MILFPEFPGGKLKRTMTAVNKTKVILHKQPVSGTLQFPLSGEFNHET